MRITAAVGSLALAAAAAAQPANDQCANAQAIVGYTTFAFDNTAATTDGAASAMCQASGAATNQIERDVWFCWTAPWGGLVSLNTCGQTAADTRIAVYDGCACPEGSGILACNDDACGPQTRVNWYAYVNQTYLIRIGVRPGAAGGSGTFNVGSGIIAGPTINPGNGHVYYLLHQSSWTQARDAANSIAGTLVRIDDAAENEWVRSELANFGAEQRAVWIGLSDEQTEGTFAWISGGAPGYSNWAPGQPDNGGTGGNEDYAAMAGGSGLWSDRTDLPTDVLVHGVVEREWVCYVDCNMDLLLNISDFGCFQARFVGGDPYADCNQSGTLTIADFGCFLSAIAAGCP